MPDYSNILRRLTIPRELLSPFFFEDLRTRHSVPVARDDLRNITTLAIDFSDPDAAEFFRFVANCEANVVYADSAAIRKALNHQ